MIRSLTLTTLFLLFADTTSAAQPILVQEPDSTTDAKLVEPSATRAIHPGEKINRLTTHGNNHAAFTKVWRDAIAERATDALRPKYRQYYGFEESTPINAEMVRRDLGAIR